LSKFLYLVGFTFPFCSWYASSNCWRFQYLVVPLPPYGLPLSGFMLAWILVLVPCLFFSTLLGCFSAFLGCFLFIKFEWVSSQSAFLDYIYNVWICGIFSICDSKQQW
jgi:hypothetical protein